MNHARVDGFWRARRPALLLVLGLVLVSLPVLAGRIVLLTGYTEQVGGMHQLNADIQYDLGSDALDALENGLPLRLTVEVEIIRPRAWWPDATVHELEKVFEIQYQPLTRLYVIRDLAEGGQESFQSHSAAMARLSRIEDLPIIAADELDQDSSYEIRMRARVDIREYPAGLGLIARLWSDSRVSSGWYQWTLQS